MELPTPSPFFNFLITYIFSIKCLLFHLFFFYLICLCPYSYNLMLTATYWCRPYTTRQESSKVYKSYNCLLRLHLLHLISIMSFKLEHVSVPKRRNFSPLFLFGVYDSSVLQNFKIFTTLLPHFSHSTFLMTEVDITHVL